MTAPTFDRVGLSARDELILRYGATRPIQIAVLQPLFGESARVRQLLGEVMRRLEAAGIGSALMDLPGSGESRSSLPAALAGWHDAVRALAERIDATHSLAIRGGALLDAVVVPDRRWRFSPATGAAIARDLVRAGTVEHEGDVTPRALAETARIAGARLGGLVLRAGLFRDLEAAAPDPGCGRTVRLAGDARPADARVEGPMLWRQAEPVAAPALADALAADLAAWIAA